MQELTKEAIAEWFKGLQDDICSSLEALDGKAKFQEDIWEREEGGGGRTRPIKDGNLIEKGGVNFSAVSGLTPEKVLKALKLSKADFFATGVSIVLHPENPWVPIIHMNVRYFEMSNGVWWFGGGIDLTPHFIENSLAKNFHNHLKTSCDKHDPAFYPKFKEWADDYFFLSHRDETRGVGGVFFDRLNDKEGKTKEQQWAFVQEIGKTFIPAYSDAITHRDKSWTDQDKQWQKLRRGRYVEFNLVHDKGTKFGLDTNGRTESILMSMPPEADWIYEYQPVTELQKNTLASLKKGIDWVNA